MPPTDHALADRCRSAANSGRRPANRLSGFVGVVIAVSIALAGCATAAPGVGQRRQTIQRWRPRKTNACPTRSRRPRLIRVRTSHSRDVATLIRSATILDGTGQRLEHTDLLLDDGKVAAIGAGLAAPEGATIIEAAGRWVTPGIIDPHSHIGNFPTPYTGEDSSHTDVNEDTDPNARSGLGAAFDQRAGSRFLARTGRRRDDAAHHAGLD